MWHFIIVTVDFRSLRWFKLLWENNLTYTCCTRWATKKYKIAVHPAVLNFYIFSNNHICFLVCTDRPLFWGDIHHFAGCRNSIPVEPGMANSSTITPGEVTHGSGLEYMGFCCMCESIMCFWCQLLRRPQLLSCSLVPLEPWLCWALLSSRPLTMPKLVRLRHL